MQTQTILRCMSLLGLVGLVACNTSLPSTPLAPSPIPIATKLSPTASPSFTITPTATATASPTLTSIPSETPWPALPKDEAIQKARELFANNAGCALPCWWGIVPGRTTWSSAQSFLHQFDQSIFLRPPKSKSFLAEVQIPIEESVFSLGFLKHVYHIVDNQVELIEIRYGTFSAYNISSVLFQYGQPDGVMVRTYLDTPSSEGIVNLELVIFYQKLGVISSYNELGQEDAKQVTTCFRSSLEGSELVLWPPKGQDTFLEIVDQTGLTSKGLAYRSLEEATGVTVTQFYEALSVSGNRLCLASPVNLWP